MDGLPNPTGSRDMALTSAGCVNASEIALCGALPFHQFGLWSHRNSFFVVST